jgi:D-alanine transaminase
MSRIAYVNGRYLPFADAALPIEDRGTQFADAIYEVWAVRDRVLLDEAGHFTRLARSLGELRIPMPMPAASLALVLRETMRRNRVTNGTIYLQISRGVAPRDHPFPTDPLRPSIVVVAKRGDPRRMDAKASKGIAVVVEKDIRWGRCDIKTVGLLPNVLARQAGIDAGADDCWMEGPDGRLTEASAANIWIVDADGVLRTPSTEGNILNGITRRTVIRLAEERQIRIQERAFTLAEAKAAREAFQTSAGGFVMPVVAIAGSAIGSGTPGPVSRALREAYVAAAKSE